MPRHSRKSIRLKGYDYTHNGAYFITICTQNRIHRFGKIDNGEIVLNDAGKIALKCWQEIPEHFTNVKLDRFVIMPNHIHGIIHIEPQNPVGAKHFSPNNGTPNPEPSTNFNDSTNAESSTVGKRCFTPTNDNHNINPENPVGAKHFSPNNRLPKIKINRPHGTSKTVGSIVRGFKIGVTKWFHNGSQFNKKAKIWQRNYWEHIIRNDSELYRIREYIVNNPKMWDIDSLN